MQHYYRRNSDEQLRKLERLVASGDAEALARYVHACHRTGKDHPYVSTLAADVGIDYSGAIGAQQSINRDAVTGIRYGLTSAHNMADWFYEVLEPEYWQGCPYCGTEFEEDIPEACPSCAEELDEDECYSEEPVSNTINDSEGDGIEGFLDSGNDVWITKSPYYMRGTYCSPCAPGAVSIGSPTTSGPPAYCPPHEWFREGRAPHLIFRVDDNTIVYPEK
jgi:hypothetical protein